LRDLPCRKEKGRIVVEETLEVPGFSGVWRLAIAPGFQIPGLANLTRQPRSTRCGRPCVARRTSWPQFDENERSRLCSPRLASSRPLAAAQVSPTSWAFSYPAFLRGACGGTIYLAKLPRFEMKLRVALDWTLELFFPKDFVQHMTLRGIEQVHQRLVYTRRHPVIPTPGKPAALPGSIPVENFQKVPATNG